MKKFISFIFLLLFFYCGEKTEEKSKGQGESPKHDVEKITEGVNVYTDNIALVVGISKYKSLPVLNSPVNDAEDISEKLKSLNFQVILVKNPTKEDLKEKVAEYSKKSENIKGVSLFYYSGHGIADKGENYLLPIETNIRGPQDIEEEGIRLGYVVRAMEEAKSSVNVVVLDACRNVPFKGIKAITNSGLAANPASGFLIVYATAPKEVALDGTGRNSPFTESFLEQIDKPLEIKTLFEEVKASVFYKTNKAQRPWLHSDIIGKVYLKKPAEQEPSTEKLSERPTENVFTNSIGMEFVSIPAGEFLMGCSSNDSSCSDDEKPSHKVKLTKGFYMGKYEVTKGEFQKFVDATKYQTEAEKGDGCDSWTDSEWKTKKEFSWRNVGFTQTENDPVVCVSWNDTQEYAKWLSKKEGKSYRLPTEAEWEYAARAGAKTKYSFGNEESKLEDYAWYSSNSGSKTHPVGQKKPNAFGLYDMLGNVWEWVND